MTTSHIGRRRAYAARRLTVLTAAAVLATTAVTSGSTVAQAYPGPPAAVFDPESVHWTSVEDRSGAQFDAAIDTYWRQGYIAVDIEIDTTASTYKAGAVFQSNLDNRGWRVLRDLTEPQFAQAKAQAEADGMRITDVETYLVAGARKYAALWVYNTEGYGFSSAHYLHPDEMKAYVENQQYKLGRMPIDIEHYDAGGAAGWRFAATWVDNPDRLGVEIVYDIDNATFTNIFNALEDRYRMIAFDSVLTPAGQRYSAVYIQNPSGQRWKFQRHLTNQQYVNLWHRYEDEGYRLIGYERYETAVGTRWSATWRQNSGRPVWPPKGAVDAELQDELDDFEVPGISVAVIQNGIFTYLRGFGHADVAGNVWLDSKHVMRLASVSKTVAGALMMDMVEDGIVDPGDVTRDIMPNILPAHHTHTLEQLVSNRGCVRHYLPEDDALAAEHFDTAVEATLQFADDPLECEPGEELYSTHGYTVLGAAFEAATGLSVSQLVTDRLTQPHGLGTLRPEDQPVAPDIRRTTLYNTDNTVATRWHVSWKVLGGGLESSARDLANFGWKLLDGQIVSTDSLDTMWNPDTDWDYAYGWSNTSQSGHRKVSKNGSYTGANTCMVLYPDDGISIVALSNRKEGGHSTCALTNAIGALMLAEIDD